jgi:hypothetical protein
LVKIRGREYINRVLKIFPLVKFIV